MFDGGHPLNKSKERCMHAVMLKGVFSKGIGYLVIVAGILTLFGTFGVLLGPLTILTLFGLVHACSTRRKAQVPPSIALRFYRSERCQPPRKKLAVPFVELTVF